MGSPARPGGGGASNSEKSGMHAKKKAFMRQFSVTKLTFAPLAN